MLTSELPHDFAGSILTMDERDSHDLARVTTTASHVRNKGSSPRLNEIEPDIVDKEHSELGTDDAEPFHLSFKRFNAILSLFNLSAVSILPLFLISGAARILACELTDNRFHGPGNWWREELYMA